MEAKFKIRTKMEDKDFTKFLFISTFRRRWHTIPGLLMISFAGASFVSSINKMFTASNIIKTWLAIIAMLSFASYNKIKAQKKSLLAKDESGLLKAYGILSFYDDELTIETEGIEGSQVIRYQEIMEVIESKDFYILFFLGKGASIIRKKDFENKADFTSFLRSKVGRPAYRKII